MVRQGAILRAALLAVGLIGVALTSFAGARDAVVGMLSDDVRNDLVAAYGGLTSRATQTADMVPMPHTDASPYAINVFLEQEVEEWKIRLTLEMARDAGFHWIKQQVRWYDIEGPTKGQYYDVKNDIPNTWKKYDRIVDLARSYGLDLIFRLDTSPDWARPGNPKEESPPDRFEDFGDFVYAVVARYKGKVRYYQIWNEPNLSFEWGDRQPDANDYVRLLRTAYLRAKEADPESVVIVAAVAPTVEISARATNDLVFLQQMYDAGAAQWFDIMSVNPYGLRSGPDDRRLGDGSDVNFSRPILVRELMVRNGDAGKPIWAAELGWNALPLDFPGEPPWGRVSREAQARYTVRAYQRMQEEWPWMGVAALWHLRMVHDVNRDKPQYYFGIVDNDFTPFPVYDAMKKLTAAEPVLYPGFRQESHRALKFSGGWIVETDEQASLGRVMVSPTAGETVSFSFEGSDFDLVASKSPASGRLAVAVDGGTYAANRLPREADGRAYVDLWSGETRWQSRITVARGLPWGRHSVEMQSYTGPQGGTEAAIDAFVVTGTPPNVPRAVAGITLLILGLLAIWGLASAAIVLRKHGIVRWVSAFAGAAVLAARPRMTSAASAVTAINRRVARSIRLVPVAPESRIEGYLRARPPLLALMLATPPLLAWGLRLYGLDAQSLWYDEGISAALSLRSIPAITADAAHDIQPPLYYYVLHLWSALAGTGEYALRFPSALYGVLTVGLTFQLGRRLVGFWVGLVAALLLAFSPIMVHYSQEARMHQQMAVLALLSMYLFVRLTLGAGRTGRRFLWAAYLVATAAMLYSHYFAFAVVLAQNGIFLASWLVARLRARRSGPLDARPRATGAAGDPSLATWLAVQVMLALLYLPWLAVVYSQLLTYPGQLSDVMRPTALLHGVFRAFTFGVHWDAVYTPRRELALAVLFVAGLLYLLAYRGPRWAHRVTLLLLYLATPIAAMYVLSLQRPAYQPRYLLAVAPAFYIVVAAGVVGLSRTGGRLSALAARRQRRWCPHLLAAAVIAALALAAFLHPATAALRVYYFDPRYARDDYRGLASYIAANSVDGDAVVLNAPGQSEIFDYYYRAPLPRYPLPRQRPIDEERTGADLEALVRRHPRVWLVLWAVAESDPHSFVEGWLDRHAAKRLDRPFGTVRLLRYDLPRSAAPEAARANIDQGTVAWGGTAP